MFTHTAHVTAHFLSRAADRKCHQANSDAGCSISEATPTCEAQPMHRPHTHASPDVPTTAPLMHAHGQSTAWLHTTPKAAPRCRVAYTVTTCQHTAASSMMQCGFSHVLHSTHHEHHHRQNAAPEQRTSTCSVCHAAQHRLSAPTMCQGTGGICYGTRPLSLLAVPQPTHTQSNRHHQPSRSHAASSDKLRPASTLLPTPLHPSTHGKRAQARRLIPPRSAS